MRIQSEMPSSSTDARNGMRQPQLSNCSVDMDERTTRITARAPIRPKAADDWIQPVRAPRRCAGACSAT